MCGAVNGEILSAFRPENARASGRQGGGVPVKMRGRFKQERPRFFVIGFFVLSLDSDLYAFLQQ